MIKNKILWGDLMNIVKKARTKNKISQSQLAKACKVTQPHISRIEADKERPSAKLINKLSTQLKICPSSVFCYFYADNCSDLDCCKQYKNK